MQVCASAAGHAVARAVTHRRGIYVTFKTLAIATAPVRARAPALAAASTSNGQRGYEGQPGNNGGSGQLGYEGQPGNQGR